MRTTSVLARAVAAVLSVSLSGCTFFGWLIGHDADAARPRVVPPLQAAEVGEGPGIELVLRDGTTSPGASTASSRPPTQSTGSAGRRVCRPSRRRRSCPDSAQRGCARRRAAKATVTLMGSGPGELCFREPNSTPRSRLCHSTPLRA